MLKEFEDKGAYPGPHQLMEFEKNEISLSIRAQEPTDVAEWAVQPSFHPKVCIKFTIIMIMNIIMFTIALILYIYM